MKVTEGALMLKRINEKVDLAAKYPNVAEHLRRGDLLYRDIAQSCNVSIGIVERTARAIGALSKANTVAGWKTPYTPEDYERIYPLAVAALRGGGTYTKAAKVQGISLTTAKAIGICIGEVRGRAAKMTPEQHWAKYPEAVASILRGDTYKEAAEAAGISPSLAQAIGAGMGLDRHNPKHAADFMMDGHSYVWVTCSKCGKRFARKPHIVAAAQAQGRQAYCSTKCHTYTGHTPIHLMDERYQRTHAARKFYGDEFAEVAVVLQDLVAELRKQGVSVPC
jgi:hypothetical protein